MGQRLPAGRIPLGGCVVTSSSRARQLAPIQPPPAAAENGNRRALAHGATSEQQLAPLRQEHAEGLRADYPQLDERRLALLADRLARLSSGQRWLDDQGGVVRDKHGNVFPIVDRMEKWGGVAWRILTELETEKRTPRKFEGLEDFMVTGGEGDGPDAA